MGNKESSHRIRNLRTAAGFSQAEVAEEAGYTRQQYSFIECGPVQALPETYTEIEGAIVRLAQRRVASLTKMASASEQLGASV